MAAPGLLSRRQALALGAGGLAAGFLTGLLPRTARAAGTGAPKRNVLFIAVDDLRPQLGCYGDGQMVSPNIDRLAAEGTLFERAYCQQAVCAPSRASLMTGLRPDSTGIYGLRTPVRQVLPDVLTLPQHLRNSGYETISLGKIYHHRRDDEKGWSRAPWGPGGSFPGYATEEANEMRRRAWERAGRKGNRNIARGPATEAGDVPDAQYPDGKLAEKALEEMRRLSDRPFFLGVGFHKPHLAFACPRRYWDLYARDDIDLADNPFRPEGAPDIALHNWGELRAYADMPREGPVSDAKARELIHGYYACVSFVDAQIGRLLAGLDRLGLRERTVVVLWGDHGWQLGEHGLWCKHSNFETSVHSPLIVSAPGHTPAGSRTRGLVEFVDVYPSLCELCGLPLPEHLEGASFVPLMEAPGRPWKRAAFSQYPRGKAMGYSMRTDRCRYTEWQRDGQVEARELYDHQTDPAENVNVAADPDSAALVRDLSARLADGWRSALPQAAEAVRSG